MHSSEAESSYAWLRLFASLALSSLGGVAMYGVVVVLPQVECEFGVARADASLPYAMTMLGFGVGGILMGRLADRFGVIVPVVIGTLGLGSGFLVAGNPNKRAAVRTRAWPARGPARLLGDLCAAHGRHVSLVHTSARHRSRHREQRKLSRRGGLAADPAVFFETPAGVPRM